MVDKAKFTVAVKTFPIVSFTNRGKRSISLPTLIDISSVPEVQLPNSQSFEEYTLYLDLTHVGSPVYTSCESKETNPHFPVPYFSNFPSPDGQFFETIKIYPDVTERSPRIFKIILYNLQVSPSKLSMVADRGGGVGGGAGGGGQVLYETRL
jgi:hypothetical protein